MSRSRLAATLAVVLFTMAFFAHAQSPSGSISGNATTGDVVDIKGADTGFHRELKIEKDGKYSVRQVPAGSYIVTVTRPDGSQVESVIEVRVGSAARVK
ncbi:Oar protein [Lysobacter dokdonensis DS-58]|uniref:Oar protein n=1 Tax=Lysobacter dokdonensis DS-58 TaxID=1300345 RepID=A0A0A2WHU1_9GAMM|nr:carboxypeptidase-like regulatory domain-containing protein [Lysobacter dokdonensis]KGQ19746.1 Oar protein [Lysobacter dokdonensis DS-58]